MSVERTKPRAETPNMPIPGELSDWKGVYFHHTPVNLAIPILFQGIWSGDFSTHPRVNSPIYSSVAPVQDEVGYDWISVHDADSVGSASRGLEYIVSSNPNLINFAIRKVFSKSKPAVAESAFPTEHLIHWRVAPRDILAALVNEKDINIPLTSYIKKQVLLSHGRGIFNAFEFLASRDSNWKLWFEQAESYALEHDREEFKSLEFSEEEYKEHLHSFKGIINDRKANTLIAWWMEDLGIDVGTATAKDFWKVMQAQTKIPIVVVLYGNDITRLLSLDNY